MAAVAMDTIGAQLAREAARRGLSQDEAAKILGVTQATFSRWTVGEAIPTSRYWTKIARFLHLTRDQVGELVIPEQSQRGVRGVRGVNERLDHVEDHLECLEALVRQVLEGRRRGAR